ncbi:MAG: hypothetical protein RX318_03270 [bacterium]|nr:hypothetical protein [bacterium]
MKQFLSQRRWERKAEAYSQIMEHLSFLIYSAGKRLQEVEGTGRLGERTTARLAEGYLQATEALSKISTTGTFLISDETVAALKKFLHDYENAYHVDYHQHVERRYSLAKECIEIIRECAKADLGNI